MRPIEINSIKNDVLDRLLRQKQLPEGLGLQMAEMASNPINDPVWRDYSIQFMGQFYERFTTESGGQKSEDGGQKAEEINQQSAIAIRQSLFSALDERSETLAGTALIGLELLSRTNEEFDRKLIVKKTVEIAADEAASPSCRLTALRLASLAGKEQGAEGMARIVDTTRRLAQTGETVLLRSAAIVTLGEVGSAADRELLDTFALSDNKQISAAAQMALKKMDSRK
jgi:HEAT repeat protein